MKHWPFSIDANAVLVRLPGGEVKTLAEIAPNASKFKLRRPLTEYEIAPWEHYSFWTGVIGAGLFSVLCGLAALLVASVFGYT